VLRNTLRLAMKFAGKAGIHHKLQFEPRTQLRSSQLAWDLPKIFRAIHSSPDIANQVTGDELNSSIPRSNARSIDYLIFLFIR